MRSESRQSKPVHSWKRRPLKVAVIAVVIPAVVLGSCYAAARFFRSRYVSGPTDAELRRVFRSHVDAFETLKSMMMVEERLVGVGPDYFAFLNEDRDRGRSFWLRGGYYENERGTERHSRNELLNMSGLSAERFERYMDLLGEVGAYRVTWYAPRPDIEPLKIHMFRFGIVPSSRTKEIVYFHERFFPEGIPSHYTVVDKTDDLNTEATWYASLGDGWYIKHTVD